MNKHEDERQLAVRVSNRQLGQLRAISRAPNQIIFMDKLAGWNQLTLGGNKRRGFVKETPRKNGVTLTQDGKEVLDAFDHADFMRRVASTHFSSYLHFSTHVSGLSRVAPRRAQVQDVRFHRAAS